MSIVSIRHSWSEKAGFTINRPNGHINYTFIHFFNSVKLKTADGRIIETQPNACIMFTPGTEQWFRSVNPLVHNWMHADNDIQPLLEKYKIPLNTVFYPADTFFITDIFAEAENEWLFNNKYCNEIINLKAKEFIIRLARNLDEKINTSLQQKYSDKYVNIRREIILNPERHWTVESMAKLASISPSRFYAVYKKIFCTSPISDLISARINAAKNYLLSSDDTVSMIAEKLGYSNQYHFIRQFKKETGKTPTEFRKSMSI